MEGKETTKIIKLFWEKGRVIPKKTGKPASWRQLGTSTNDQKKLNLVD